MRFDGQVFYSPVAFIEADRGVLRLNGRSITLSKVSVHLLKTLYVKTKARRIRV